MMGAICKWEPSLSLEGNWAARPERSTNTANGNLPLISQAAGTARLFALLAGFLGALAATAFPLPAHADWLVNIQNEGAAPEGNIVGGTVNDINEAEDLLGNGGAFEAAGLFDVVNFDNAFPAGTASGNFALEASGYVDILGGTTGLFNLIVDSDDGFRLRLNGAVVAEFVPDGTPHISLNGLALSDGDFLRLTMFQQGGGERIVLRRDFDGIDDGFPDKTFVGSATSGIDIVQVPEPGSFALAVLGALSAVVLRFKRDDGEVGSRPPGKCHNLPFRISGPATAVTHRALMSNPRL